MRALRNMIVAVVATAGLGLIAVPAANAEFKVSISGGPTLTPASTTPGLTNPFQAGAHPNLSLTMDFAGSSEKVRNMNLDLPPGLLGDPGSVPTCTLNQANTGECPMASQVGEVTAWVTATLELQILPPPFPPLTGDIDLIADGGIYVMQPRPVAGKPLEPARLFMRIQPKIEGIALGDPITSEVPIHLRSPGDFGLTNIIRDLPRTSKSPIPGLPDLAARINKMQMTLWGTPPSATRPFMINPTTCGPMTVNLWAESYDGSTKSVKTAPFSINDCDTLKFEPTMTVTPNPVQAVQPTELAMTVGFPAPSAARAQAHLKDTEVVLPEGFAMSAGVGADGLDGCTDEQFGANKAGRPTCPMPGSKIGSVLFDSPLVGAVTGDVYLGTSTPDARFRLFVYAVQGQVEIKLVGNVNADPVTGQLTTVFPDAPKQPFLAFKLAFRGGPTATLKAPDTCGEMAATSKLTAWAGMTASPKGNVTVEGCKPAQFAPTMDATATPTQAAGFTTVRTLIKRTDADARLVGTNVSMPPGLLGMLTAIPQCPIANARAGNCAAESRIGTVITSAGTGPKPALLSGPVYLSEGYDGSLAGLAIIVDAKVGPIDLGKVVVMGKLTTRPDLGIDMAVENMPTIVGGVPLYMQAMDLVLNRPGFMFNASSCAPQQISATFTGLGGATAATTVPYQATGCEALAFNPVMSAKVTGNTSTPGFETRISGQFGDSTMRGTELKLPPALGASLKGVANTCPQADYNAGNCKPAAVIGSVHAETPLLPLPLDGPVTLVKLDGQVLPGLAMKLRGMIAIDLVVTNSVVGGRLTSTINGVPDSPISAFDLKLNPNALLQAEPKDLCEKKQQAGGKFTAWSGAVVSKDVDVDVSEVCGKTSGEGDTSKPKHLTVASSLKGIKRGRTPTLNVRLGSIGTRLTSLKVSIPRNNLRVVSSKLRGRARGTVGGKLTPKSRRLPLRVTSKTSTLTIKPTGSKARTGSGSLGLRIGQGALRRHKIRVGQRVTLRLSYTMRGSKKVQTMTVRVKARS